MKIISISIGILQIPLIRPFITAVRKTENVEDIVVIIKTDNGSIGYGTGAATTAITGDSQESIISAIKNILAPKLIGKNIEELNHLLHITDTALHKNTSAKAAIDIALHDLFAQKCHLPLYKLLGGHTNTINSCITISINNVEEMANDAKLFVNDGFNVIKIKVGLNPNDDIIRVSAIRKSVGNDIQLLVDANQGWSAKDALRIITSFEQQNLNVSLIEQPVIAHDLANLKHIRDNVNSFIMADEACFSPHDALIIAKDSVADGINIKLMKSGGINNAKAIYNIARAADIKLMVGCMLESPVGIAAIASFAMAYPEIIYADLDPIALIQKNYVLGGASIKGNTVILADKPGLGIEGFSHGFTLLEVVV